MPLYRRPFRVATITTGALSLQNTATFNRLVGQIINTGPFFRAVAIQLALSEPQSGGSERCAAGRRSEEYTEDIGRKSNIFWNFIQ